MDELRIKSILGISPRHKPRKLTVITRGATAKLEYVLTDKWFSFETLEQVTYSFKQRTRLLWYNMFIYLLKTEDTTVDEYKTYYKNVTPIEPGSRQCNAELVLDPVSNPKQANYYEVVDITDGQNDLYYLIDDHFYYTDDGEREYITFVFSSEETETFSPTEPGAEVKFEIALRFNTDSHVELTNKDSVIIDPQPPLIVADSLYSRVNSDGDCCSDDTDMVVSTSRLVG